MLQGLIKIQRLTFLRDMFQITKITTRLMTITATFRITPPFSVLRVAVSSSMRITIFLTALQGTTKSKSIRVTARQFGHQVFPMTSSRPFGTTPACPALHGTILYLTTAPTPFRRIASETHLDHGNTRVVSNHSITTILHGAPQRSDNYLRQTMF